MIQKWIKNRSGRGSKTGPVFGCVLEPAECVLESRPAECAEPVGRIIGGFQRMEFTKNRCHGKEYTKELVNESDTPSPGGAADRFAHSAGP